MRSNPKADEKISIKKVIFLLLFIVASIVILNLHKPVPNANNSSAKVTKYPTNSANSLWAVVNKGRALPDNYVPSPLVAPNVPLRLSKTDPEMLMRADAASAFEKLVNGAKADNLNLELGSGYRSFAAQKQLYQYYVDNAGQEATDSASARPGHSEHQTGLAVDVQSPDQPDCQIHQCFGDTPEGKWLAANAYKYGFIIRYEKNKSSLTGFKYEPWHIRYVGTDLAAKIHKNDVTLEEYFNLPAYPDYPKDILTLNP